MLDQENKVKKRRKRFSKPLIVLTVFVQIILSLIICVLLVFYSPLFTTVKKFIVSSAMESRTQQYIARIFLSDSQIDDLIGSKTTSSESIDQNVSSVKTANIGDDSIEQYRVSGGQFSGYVLKISNPLRVKVGMTKSVGVVGEFTSAIAERFGAVAAINGGGFQGGVNWSDSAQNPTNFVFHNGELIWKAEKQDPDEMVNTIGIDKKGILIVGNHSINDLEELGISEAVTLEKNAQNDFRPLIVNGEGQFSEGSSESRAPRTAIAQLSDGSILLVVLDGRQVGQFGATYYELQQMLIDRFGSDGVNVETATILDGGGSSTMYYNGEVINNPSAAFGERTVATAFYVES